MIENLELGYWLFGFGIGFITAFILALIKEYLLLKKLAELGVIEYE